MTASAKHTPGPWFAHDSRGWRVWPDARRAQTPVASVAFPADRDGQVTSSAAKAEAAANARLIAAAPDLLAALRDMVEAYRDSCADDEQPSMVKAALAAIAQAAQP